MKLFKLEGINNKLIFKLGKHKFMGIDLIPIVAEYLKISKAESKRLFKDGAVDTTYRVQEVVEE